MITTSKLLQCQQSDSDRSPGPERLDTNIKGFRHGTRKQGKSLRRVTMVRAETLSQVDQSKQLHFTRLGAAALAHATAIIKEIDPPRPAQQISQIRKLPMNGVTGERDVDAASQGTT